MASSHRVHYFHLIGSTKGRQELILPKIQDSLYSYMKGIANNANANFIEIGGISNHVHVLMELSNLDHYTIVIRNTKAASTGWLKKVFPECNHFAWQDGYASFSVSYSQIDHVRQYILNQEKHHRTQKFEEEYIKLLQLNKIQFNEKFYLITLE